ncbi:nucleotidyltransferase family protein [Rubrivirga marina]|uniref:Nucleotidyltransferase family protein n=1 Tax=Rubrivirga marina TaxID=1196024 RepID=A0A271IZD9_9BACT|nr:nucleotidyltransferase family protein [Rubrivirga marina]PAP75859.1 hypothetical protein BSZ37_05085 [Rubrivirga marina]
MDSPTFETAVRLGPPSAVERDLMERLETRLLLLAARPAPPADLGERVARLAPAVDAEAFVGLAAAHRVVPHAARSLVGLDAVPGDLRDRLRRRAAENARRQLAMAAALGRVLGALGRAGVPALPLKGPALAAALFGDPGQRTSIDLDVLVDPGSLFESFAAVEGEGFVASGKVRELTAAQAAVVAAEFRVHDAAFWHPGLRVSLELHWRPFRDRRLTTLADALTMELALNPTGLAWRDRALSAAEAAYVLVHGAAHGYRRLGWLVDAAGLAERLNEAAWREVHALAAADGVEAAVLLGPALAHRWLGAPLPDALRPRVDSEADRLGRLAGWCLTRTPDRPRTLHPATVALGAALYDRSADRLRHVWRLLTSPASGELAEVDLRPGAVGRARRLAARPARLVRNGARWFTGSR